MPVWELKFWWLLTEWTELVLDCSDVAVTDGYDVSSAETAVVAGWVADLSVVTMTAESVPMLDRVPAAPSVFKLFDADW